MFISQRTPNIRANTCIDTYEHEINPHTTTPHTIIPAHPTHHTIAPPLPHHHPPRLTHTSIPAHSVHPTPSHPTPTSPYPRHQIPWCGSHTHGSVDHPLIRTYSRTEISIKPQITSILY